MKLSTLRDAFFLRANAHLFDEEETTPSDVILPPPAPKPIELDQNSE
jgi:hypothetical protein